MGDRSQDWLRQAEADLKHAELSQREGDYEWSCFAAQQAAEKAVKALYMSLHGDAWGHSLLALLRSLPQAIAAAVGPEILDAARALDKLYIPTRYPNGFDMGAPADYFTERDARESVAYAKSILTFCRARLSGPE